MFSSRLNWELRRNRLSQLIEQKRRSGVALLDLTESNPTLAGFEYPASMLDALVDPRSVEYRPAAAGLIEAREAVAAWYAAQGCKVEPAQILLAASTSECYSWLFKLLGDPGDEILVPRPSYPLFDYLAALEGLSVVRYPLLYDGRWHVDTTELARAAGERTRAIVVVHPNNPTGSFLKRSDLAALDALGVPIISDEVFSGYALGDDPDRVTTLAASATTLAFALNGLSKFAGLPQMKLGWMVVSGPPAVRTAALNRLELIADTYLSVGTPVMHALPRLLESGATISARIAARVRDNLGHLRARIAGHPECEALDVEGGWYAIVRVPRTRTEEEWCLELAGRDHVLVQPGFFYDFDHEAYLVLSLITPPQIFEEGLKRLLARVAVL